MNTNKLQEISSEITYIINNYSNENDRNNQLKLLFLNLMEFLGYDESMIITPGCVYGTETLFDICLKTDIYDDSSDLIYVRYEDYGSDISNSKEQVENAILYNINPEDNKTKYYLISNGIAIKVYSNKPIASRICNIEDLGIIDMQNLMNSVYLLNNFKINKEENDDFEYNDEKIEENIEKEVKENKFKNLLPSNKESIIKIALMIGAILLLIIVMKFLFFSNNKEKEVSNTNITETISEKSKDDIINETKVNLEANNTDTVSYLSIKAVLDLTVNNENLKINLISNLPENAVVKIGIFCGDDSQYVYLKTDKEGTGITNFEIPATWGEEKIIVGAYLKFNEEGYKQPSAITKKFGEKGENIEWNPDYSKDMITYSETTHINALVKALLKENQDKKNRELMDTIQKDFSEIDTRVDSFGNIKHVPKGYSFDETNVSEKVNIYPMIFYDKETNTSYFYIICGYVGTQFLRFEGVSYSCDGYNWNYENSTNDKKNKIVGNKKAEWVYFNSIDNSALLGDMQVVSNANDSKMILTGSVNKTFTLSTEEKNIIKQFLYIYKTYYGNGTTVPDTSWFSISGTKISLKYLITPNKMYQRGYKEINSLNAYNQSLSTKRLNGENITTEEQELLDKMNITYRPVSKTIQEKIMNSLLNSNAVSEYYGDYETDKKYMKIYFDYGNIQNNIENGYIPYINIYEDLTVIVPIKTIDSATTKYDKCFAKFSISQTIYNELETYFNNTSYEQIN